MVINFKENKMIHHYHGLPIWGDGVMEIATRGSGAFVSHAWPQQTKKALDSAGSVAFDNGAFSAWRSGKPVKDWTPFYQWLMRHYHNEKLEFFIIPDVIDGNEEDNDKLIDSLPLMFKEKAVPTWHLHESIDRLVRLCEEWPKVCFGSSGEYAVIRTKRWHERMTEAFTEIYIKRNLKTKIHGLRMLDGRVLGNYPLHTADSTNLACNVPKFDKKYPELTRAIIEAEYSKSLDARELKQTILRGRAAVLKGAVENVKPPSIEEWIQKQALE